MTTKPKLVVTHYRIEFGYDTPLCGTAGSLAWTVGGSATCARCRKIEKELHDQLEESIDRLAVIASAKTLKGGSK